MCLNCAVEYVLDIECWDEEEHPWETITWPPFTVAMLRLAALIEPFYSLPSCGTGGPLHVVVDDYNLDAESLTFCRRNLEDPNESGYYASAWPEVHQMALEILDLMDGMSEPERATALAKGDGFL